MIELSETVRLKGLSHLKEKVESVGSEFLKLAASAVVDAYDPAFVVEVASNAYWADEPEGVQALADYIYLRGMLCIQQGDPPLIMQEIFQSLMPMELCEGFMRQMEEKRLCMKELEEKYRQIRIVSKDADILETIHKLEEMVRSLNRRCLQIVLKDIDVDDLAGCVYAMDPEIREKIMDNISRRYAYLIMDQMVHDHRIRSDDKKVSKSMRYMIEHMEKLKEAGEVILEKIGS